MRSHSQERRRSVDRGTCGPGIQPRKLVLTQDDSTLYHILELTNIAGPVVILEQSQSTLLYVSESLPSLFRILFNQILHEERHIILSFTQRRYPDWENIQTIE